MTLARQVSLGCIADDYTGASDLANTLTRQGLRTVQTIGVPSGDLKLPEVDAVVISLKSRSIEAREAVARSRDAEKWLRSRGAGHVLFKICSTFDSSPAMGSIGCAIDIGVPLMPGRWSPMVVAAPRLGRYQAFGDVFIQLNHKDPTDYRRELDIDGAIQRVAYRSGGVAWRREAFASHPAGVIVVRFTADKPGAYSGRIWLSDMHGAVVTASGAVRPAGKVKLVNHPVGGRGRAGRRGRARRRRTAPAGDRSRNLAERGRQAAQRLAGAGGIGRAAARRVGGGRTRLRSTAQRRAARPRCRADLAL